MPDCDSEKEKSSQVVSNKSNVELIFDNNLLTFKSIIQDFEKNKNLGLTFSIFPENASFIIGSNSSNDRGEVILIKE